MELRELIGERKGAILDRWFDAVIATYPPDSHMFFRERADRFANPVGTTIRESLSGILDRFLDGDDAGSTTPFLEDVLRVRAVQGFAPSQALGFVLELKRIVRQVLAGGGTSEALAGPLARMDARIDDLALRSFDVFIGFREKVYELRSQEWKNRMFTLLRKAGLVGELGGDGPGDGC
jgi:hypothetical protein